MQSPFDEYFTSKQRMANMSESEFAQLMADMGMEVMGVNVPWDWEREQELGYDNTYRLEHDGD